MNSGLISTPYATTLLDYSISLNQHEEVYERMKILSEVFLRVPELRAALADASILDEDKKNIMHTAIGGNVPSSLIKMADLIFENKREDLILYIAFRFIELYRHRFHIQYGKLITAVPINESKKNILLSRLQEIVGENLEIEPVVDPDLIGGFVLHLSDYRWDASVSGELTRIKGKLKKMEARNVLI